MAIDEEGAAGKGLADIFTVIHFPCFTVYYRNGYSNFKPFASLLALFSSFHVFTQIGDTSKLLYNKLYYISQLDGILETWLGAEVEDQVNADEHHDYGSLLFLKTQ